MRFSEIYRHWREEKKSQVKPTTMAAYTYLAERHLLPEFGRNYKISSSDVQQFVNNLHERGLSRRSISGIISVMRLIMEFGMEKDWFEIPKYSPKLPPHTKSQTLDVFDMGNEALFINHLITQQSILDIALLTTITSGLRLGEVCGLQVRDVQPSMHICHINRTVSLTYDNEEHRTCMIVNLPKTLNSIRTIPIHPIVEKLILELPHFIPDKADHYLFTNTTTPLHPNALRKHYRNTIRQLNLPALRFHALRHTFATRCIESGCDIKTLSSILGHSSVQTTLNLYVHPSMEQKHKSIINMMRYVMDTTQDSI